MSSKPITKNDLKAILENVLAQRGGSGSGGGGGGDEPVDATPVPTVNKVAKFDSSACMNSSDMIASEIDAFIADYEDRRAEIANEAGGSNE